MHCHSAKATYLFQQDKFYDTSLDTGDKSIQCGRKVDCLKLWLMWKAIGTHGLSERVDKAFALARYLMQMLLLNNISIYIISISLFNVAFCELTY